MKGRCIKRQLFSSIFIRKKYSYTTLININKYATLTHVSCEGSEKQLCV